MYSVFNASTPSIGFAKLSDEALALNGLQAALPAPTVGSPSATVTGKTSKAFKTADPSSAILWLAVACALLTL